MIFTTEEVFFSLFVKMISFGNKTFQRKFIPIQKLNSSDDKIFQLIEICEGDAILVG